MSKAKPNPAPEKTKNNGIPLVIIAGVFILAIGASRVVLQFGSK